MSKQLPEPMQTGETWDQTGFEPDLTSDISGRAMANWISAVSGNFNTKANWSPHRAPIYSTVHKDNAILTVAGANYTVTVTTNEDIKGLQLASNATLDMTGPGEFLAHANVINAGAIKVEDGYTFSTLGASLNNSGTVSLNAVTNNVFFDVEANLVVSGGGKLVMSDSALNAIMTQNIWGNGTVVLTNAGNVISGAGDIGNGGISSTGALALVNQSGGIINATGTLNPLRITTPGVAVTNGGLIEATGAAGLDIAATTVNGAGGTILAANGSVVRLEAATIAGGTLQTSGTGIFVASGGSTLDGTAATLNNQGLVEVVDNDTLGAQGNLNNSGTLALSGTVAGSHLLIGTGNLTLTGGGRINLGDTAVNTISAAASGQTLINVNNLITGDGQIGVGNMGLVNQAAGVIHEDGVSGMFIDTGGSAVVNAGLIVASNIGGIAIEGPLNNSGVVDADGLGDIQVFGAIKNTGTLEVTGGILTAYDSVTGGGTVVINGGVMDFTGSFNEAVTFAGGTSELQLAHSQSFTASITGFSKTGASVLDLGDIAFVGSGEATFSGGAASGILTVTDGTHTASIKLKGDYRSQTFVAESDGAGGVVVAAITGPAPPPSTQGFVAAMAGMGASVGVGASAGHQPAASQLTMLALPSVAHA